LPENFKIQGCCPQLSTPFATGKQPPSTTKTKDPLYVKDFLGHEKLDTTLLYIQIERAIYKEQSDEFTVRVAKTQGEIKSLLEVGFEYMCQKDGLAFFRKRK